MRSARLVSLLGLALLWGGMLVVWESYHSDGDEETVHPFFSFFYEAPDENTEDESISLLATGRRLLAQFTTLREPVVIPLGDRQVLDNRGKLDWLQHAYQHIFLNLQRQRSQFIAYPYSFKHTDPETGAHEEFREGAILKTNPSGLPLAWQRADFFRYLASEDIQLWRAKALYDTNIGILKVEAKINGRLRDVTYESGYYCGALHTYLGKYAECLRSQDYRAYLERPGHEDTSLVFLNETDIATGFLFEDDGSLRFGMLIVPDIVLGAHDILLNALGESGQLVLKDYIQRGGTIYSSGKSALIMAILGLIPRQSVHTEFLLTAHENFAYVKGCLNSTRENPHHDENYIHRLVCMGLLHDTEERASTYLLSSYEMDNLYDVHLDALLYFDSAQSRLLRKIAATGETMPYPGEDPPMVFHKYIGKGQLVINLAHSTAKSDFYFPLFYNTVLMALGKNVIINTWAEHKIPSPWVEADVFPALEAGILLNSTYEIVNLYDDLITDIHLRVWIPKYFETLATPKGCLPVNLTKEEEEEGIFVESFSCPFDSLEAFENITLDFQLLVADARATQKGRSIPVSYGTISYTVQPVAKEEYVDIGYTYVRAFMAALLRTDYNIDPSSFYPLPGKGYPIDPVLTCGNKENTRAHEVEHIAIVPLVSPLLDANDQAMMLTELEFYDAYYKKGVNRIDDYKYPFPPLREDRSRDFIDYKLLSARGEDSVTLDADWDMPVKRRGYARDDPEFLQMFPEFQAVTEDLQDITNAEYDYDIQTINLVLMQTSYPDADKHFEHAYPRLMPFLDVTNPAGANAKWGSNIPQRWKNTNHPGTARRRLTLSRTDVFFRPVYPGKVPLGMERNDTAFITVDRYPNPACKEGGASEKVVDGFFSHTIPGGLKADEFSNPLQADCSNIMIHYDDVEEWSGGLVEKTHYLLPLLFDGLAFGDLLFFDGPDHTYTDSSGRNYPEISMVFAHETTFLLDPKYNRLGGYLEYTLPAELHFDGDPFREGNIMYSVDHIALRRTEYDATTHVVRSYFQRGNMPNERYGKPSVTKLAILGGQWEGAVPANFTLNVAVYSLLFDFSSRDSFERYFYEITLEGVLFTCQPFLKLPALKMRYRLHRGEDGSESYINPYEQLEPFVRYGLYYQDIDTHSTIWGIAESHLVNNPGRVTNSGTFSSVSTIGISSVPFKEYLTTGARQIIPYAAENSRVEWKDIWGRLFSQPVRSTFVDVPPIPPPLRNFMMTTTFELLHPDTGERFLEWLSDRPIDVRVHIKLLNNFQKFFDPTGCTDNEHFIRRGISDGDGRIYDYDPDDPKYDVSIGDSCFLSIATEAKYGVCWDEDGSYLEGHRLTAAQREAIHGTALCEVDIEDCPLPDDMPVLRHRKETETADPFNYSPEVEANNPHNYIKGDMWDLTHIDYQDSVYFKGYPFHMDNRLPNVDLGLLKPHNIIAAPVWKGLGYQIFYDEQYSNPAFSEWKGWWSDNLQNKDDTLLAGQAESYDISVDKDTLLPDGKWIDILSLEDAGGIPETRLGNIYTCSFNRHRVKVDPTNPVFSFPPNVLINNVVPIQPYLTSNHRDLTRYDCFAKIPYPYTPYNISEVDNVVRTNSARDWLYFGANLRGGAKETINIILKIRPFPDIHFEGPAKVYDGGRFVYWNPANGPNSFLVVDNPPQMVSSKRTDLTVNNEILPQEVTTSEAEFYHIITIEDPAEKLRQFRTSPYYNYYGFGDSAVHVYVGDDGGRSILRPGQTSIVKIEFMNNAGFDWHMKKGAMESPIIDQSGLKDTDLLSDLVVSMQDVSVYNFLQFTSPTPGLMDYLIIDPSHHIAGWQPVFFDFSNINVCNIRDGYKGTFFLTVTVNESIPLNVYGGRIHEINANILYRYFDSLPGFNDPTREGFHTYDLLIPPIVIGIPYGNDFPWSWYRGRVFATLGFAHDVIAEEHVPEDIHVESARRITKSNIQRMRQLAVQYDDRDQLLREYYATFTDHVSFERVNETYNEYLKGQKIIFDLKKNGVERLPIPGDTETLPGYQLPDEATYYIALRCTAPILPYGTQEVARNMFLTYKDFTEQVKSAEDDLETYHVVAKGASIFAKLDAVLVSDHTLLPVGRDYMIPGSHNILRVTVQLTNDGSAVSYNVRLIYDMGTNITVLADLLNVDHEEENLDSLDTDDPLDQGPRKRVTLFLNVDLPPGDSAIVVAYFAYDAPDIMFGSKTFLSDSVAGYDLTPSYGVHDVRQRLNRGLMLNFNFFHTVGVVLRADVHVNKFRREVAMKIECEDKDVLYTVNRRNKDQNTWERIYLGQKPEYTDYEMDRDQTEVEYIAGAVRMDDEAIPEPVEVGQSDILHVHVPKGLDRATLSLILIAAVLFAGILAFVVASLFGWRKGRKYYYLGGGRASSVSAADAALSPYAGVKAVDTELPPYTGVKAVDTELPPYTGVKSPQKPKKGRRGFFFFRRQRKGTQPFVVKKRGDHLIVLTGDTGAVRLEDFLRQPGGALQRAHLIMEDVTPGDLEGVDLQGVSVEMTTTKPHRGVSEPFLTSEIPTTSAAPTAFVALWDFHAERPDEMTIREGDHVTVVDQPFDGWFVAENMETRERGLVPAAYLRP